VPVRELLGRMSSSEMSEWIAYAQIEPFGEERADLRAAIIASTVANTARQRGSRAFKPEDFMPQFGGRKAPDEQELKSKVDTAFRKLSGRPKK